MRRAVDFADRVEVQFGDGREGEVVGFEWAGDQEDVRVEFADGTTELFEDYKLKSYGPWEVPVGTKEYSRWRVAPAVQGSGLALLVDRGIPCEGHTHVLTRHTTNPVSWRTAKAVLKDKGEAIEKQIDAFVQFQHTLPYGDRASEALKDAAGVLFMQYLLEVVAGECERRGS